MSTADSLNVVKDIKDGSRKIDIHKLPEPSEATLFLLESELSEAIKKEFESVRKKSYY